MKTTLIYLHVTKSGYPTAAPPEYYLPFSQRWVNTYRQFDAGASHELCVVSCGAEPDEPFRQTYKGLYYTTDTYLGAGSDIGACQWAMQRVDADFVVCMSTPVYFHHPGWLKRLLEAREHFGDGLYGPMSSYQNTPHIRTSCWCVDPKTFAQYPHVIDNRGKCSWAESFDHGPDNPNEHWSITGWYESLGKPVMMVTWTRIAAKSEWRTIPEVFRKGKQGDCMVHDQHWDVYACAHYHERLKLERMADGITEPLLDAPTNASTLR